MEAYLSSYQYASRRLISFLATLFVRLNLGCNNFTWNVVRLCVRSGFHVRYALADTLRPNSTITEIHDGQIVCHFCDSIAYASLNEFVHTVFLAYNDRRMSVHDQENGIIAPESDFYHLPHRDSVCDRVTQNHNDLNSYVDLMALRRMCATAYATNGAVIRTEGNYVCRICMTRTTDVSTMPCGHVYACFDCLLTSLQKTRTPTNCFICREIVTGIQQLYFA